MKFHYKTLLKFVSKTDLLVPLGIGLLVGGLFAPRLLSKNILMEGAICLFLISYFAYERRLQKEVENWKIKYQLLKQIIKSTDLDIFNYDYIETTLNNPGNLTKDNIQEAVKQDSIFKAMVAGKITQKVFGNAIEEEISNNKINESLAYIVASFKNDKK